ncbi:hypothetical protein DYH09_19700 [bacterium CPR1]|nr:hypothetical protein [bacterium CPR1]
MSPQELEQAIKSGEQAVVECLQAADENERRAAAPVAVRMYAAWRSDPLGASKSLGGPAALALLGTASLSELRKAHLDAVWDHERAVAVLRQRRPDWLSAWVDWTLEKQPFISRWGLARRLEREGLIARPEGEGYWLGMIVGTARNGALRMLELDPELLELVFQLFEVEGSGELSLAAHDKYTREQDSWAYALRELAGQGRLDRQRLLDASLQALARDFEQFRAGWFSRFHESMQPTREERLARLDSYRGLLSSRIPPTVTFALKALAELKADPGEHLAPALNAREKGTVRLALKLLAGSQSPRKAFLAAEALSHSAAEVQKEAWSLVQRHGSPADPELRRALEERLGGLSATLAPDVRAWLGASEPARVASAPQPVKPEEPVRVRGLADAEELLELLARLLETGEPALDLERAMDGVSRLSDQKPGKAGEPLLKRARQKLARPGGRCQAEMARLALAWLAREQVERAQEPVTLGAFLSARVEELCARVLAGQVGPLLALPSWSSLGIEPSDLAARLPGGRLDLIQALHRLLPGPPETFRGVAGEEGAVLRFALGGDEKVGSGSGLWSAAARMLGKSNPSASLWAAAARVRCPASDCPEVEARYPGLGRALQSRLRIVPRHGHLWVEADCPAQSSLELPGQQIWLKPGDDSPADRRWQATVWPAGRHAWWAQGCLELGNNLDWWEADWADIVYLESLLEPRPLDAYGRRLLALGLAAREPAQSGMSVDALARALTEGRLSGAEMADSMAEVAELAKPGRWARTLGTVARLSEAHAGQAHAALERLLGQAPPAGELIELLVELGARLGRPLTDPAARRALEQVKGNGKAAKLARAARAQN